MVRQCLDSPALAISLVEAGVRILTEMATFAAAGVSEKGREGEKVGKK